MDLLHEAERGLQLLGPFEQLGGIGLRDLADVTEDLAEVTNRLDDVARAGFALGADHARTLGDATERLTQVGGTAHERHVERPLVDVMGLIRGGQHLGLVDVVDPERLQDLRLGEVTDAGLGHDRNGHRRLDLLDHLRIAHAGDAAVAADVGGHPLEGHDGARTGVLGDPRLCGVDDVHDDATLQHLGEAALDLDGAAKRRRSDRGG